MSFGWRTPTALPVVVALLCSVVTGVDTSVAASSAAGPDRPKPPESAHTRLLDEPQHGRRAIRSLGDQMRTAAARNRMTKVGLQRLLTDDPTAWVDTRGRIFFVDPVRGSAATALPSSGLAPPAALPYAETFDLHSKPWAPRKIFLDFDGGDVSGTLWNAQGLLSGVQPGFSLDDSTDFTDAERDVVQDVWARVSEDYSPFEVDVTTADPGDAGLRRSDEDDPSYGVQVLVTGSAPARAAVCGGSCAGIAYFYAFDQLHPDGEAREDQPVWVFSASMDARPAAMAEVASHEVGHTLGLSHDGLGVEEYYPHGGLWSPIMGAGYTPLTQFSDGSYPGSTNHENDLAVVANQGARLMSDDHGDSPGQASVIRPPPATASSGSATISGTIGSAGDQDVFAAVRDCEGPFDVDVTPATSGANLDVGVRLLDTRAEVVDTAAPPTSASGSYPDQATSGLDAHLAIPSLPAGRYYIEVDGVGQTDYSDYGSLGGFTVSVSGCVVDPGPTPPGRPLGLDVQEHPGDGSTRLTWQPPSDDGGSALTDYRVFLDGNQVGEVPAGGDRTYTFARLGEADHTFAVRGVTATAVGLPGLTHRHPVLPPSEPRGLTVSSYGLPPGQARVSWVAPAQLNGNTALSYWVRCSDAGSSTAWVHDAGGSLSMIADGLTENETYAFESGAVGADSLDGPPSPQVRFTYHRPRIPGPPRIRHASSGAPGGRSTARARWWAPVSDGGAPVAAYHLTALRMSTSGAVTRRRTVTVGPSVRMRKMWLAPGEFRFVVTAVNRVGAGRSSARSDLVTAR